MQLDINTDAAIKFTQKLDRLRRSALPVAVRSALNSAAFDVKKDTMPAEAADSFEHRKPAFFKANSKVVPAQGFSLHRMHSTIGFTPKSGNDKSVHDLEQQEHGGNIGGRSFIPLKSARVGGSWNKNVRSGNRISDIRSKIIDSKDAKGENPQEKFTKSAIHAGKGGWVIGNKRFAGGKILFSIRSVKRIKRNTVIKSVPMFSVFSGRKVRPKATRFMEKASNKSRGKIEGFYVEAARKQIEKEMNR